VRTHVHTRHRMICAELYIAYLCIRKEGRRRRGERATCVLYRDIFNTFTVVPINGYITTLCQQMGKSQLSLYKHIQEKERLHKLPTRRRCKPCGKHCSNRYTQDIIGILLYDRGDTNHLEGNSIFFRPVTTISGKQGEIENLQEMRRMQQA